MLNPKLQQKAIQLGDMDKYAHAFSPVLTLPLAHFYTNVVKPFKPRNPIETIACLWINRLREVKAINTTMVQYYKPLSTMSH